MQESWKLDGCDCAADRKFGSKLQGAETHLHVQGSENFVDRLCLEELYLLQGTYNLTPSPPAELPDSRIEPLIFVDEGNARGAHAIRKHILSDVSPQMQMRSQSLS